LLGFRPFTPDRWLEEGEELGVWEGLRVVGLPGHTRGHCGFLCPGRKLFFSGDLYASHGWWAHFPPRIFNSEPEHLHEALARTLALDLEGILPNHGDRATPEEHLRRLRVMAERIGR
jgi:glyoxylase-like metal-dependent hydrolase (beta-lactamase superfamily II)